MNSSLDCGVLDVEENDRPVQAVLCLASAYISI